jgi:adenosylcobinamide kinase/adenosylcobinamide-phosphate guanylyltransferase
MRTVETDEARGPALADALRALGPGEIAVVDSLGTWLSSYVAAGEPLEGPIAGLLAALAETTADVVLVAEETGWGVVPPYPLGRIFRDALGRLTATIAGRAERVELVVAGYAVDLRAAGRRISEP